MPKDFNKPSFIMDKNKVIPVEPLAKKGYSQELQDLVMSMLERDLNKRSTVDELLGHKLL